VVIIAVASGKGGTGKTTVATSLALALAPHRPVCFLDCDVEAPNAHLFLKPVLDVRKLAVLPVPQIDQARCQHQGTCAKVCQFNAIAIAGETVLVFPDLCHGCGSCMLNCPAGAIIEQPHRLGILESGRANTGIRFARGMLDIGQPLAVPVIRQLKQWFRPRPDETVIIDAPPGTSCPTVESLQGADYALLVTEPTPFGLHDLRLAYELTRELGLPAGVIINRDGIGDSGTRDFCASVDLPVLLHIPLDRALTEGLAQGVPLVALRPQYTAHLWRVLEMIGHRLRETAC
jgi:MinD superfamily P-loop ATPase